VRLMLLEVKAYTSDVRGEPCAAARDRTSGLVSVRICAGRGVDGSSEQGPDPSRLLERQGRRVVEGQLGAMTWIGRMTRAAKGVRPQLVRWNADVGAVVGA
jgi:hypothetical protein